MLQAIFGDICPVNGKTHVECLKLSFVTFSLYMARLMLDAWSYLWWYLLVNGKTYIKYLVSVINLSTFDHVYITQLYAFNFKFIDGRVLYI